MTASSDQGVIRLDVITGTGLTGGLHAIDGAVSYEYRF